MVPVEFKAMLVSGPFKRTAKGARYASVNAQDMAAWQIALLRRFNGATPFELLLAMDESPSEMTELAWQLYEKELIAPVDAYAP